MVVLSTMETETATCCLLPHELTHKCLQAYCLNKTATYPFPHRIIAIPLSTSTTNSYHLTLPSVQNYKDLRIEVNSGADPFLFVLQYKTIVCCHSEISHGKWVED